MIEPKPYTGSIKIHRTILEEVSKYPQTLDAVREYICNAWDADSERLEITVSSDELKIEDWGSGIGNWDLFWGVADQHKSDIQQTRKFKRKPIGRKGLGKLSFSMLGEEISVETRTMSKAEFSYPVNQFQQYKAVPRKRVDEVLTHKGTQIQIRNLKVKLDKEKIIQYVKENLYGLILPIACPTHPMMILVNGEKVQPRRFDGIPGLISTEFGNIHCNLTPSKSPKIDALYRGVKVREVNPAPSHPAKGYFDVDWVTPTPDRSHFTDSNQSAKFFEEMRNYLLRNIPTKDEQVPKELEKTIKELAKMFDDIIKDLLPQAQVPVSKTSQPSDLMMAGINENNPAEEDNHSEQQESENEKPKRQHKILRGPEKPIKSAYGVNYVMRKAGSEKPAVIPYKDEKLIIINRDHLMIKTINKMKPLLRQTCLIPLLSRGLWHILHDYTDLKRYEETIDDMSTDILTKLFSEDE